MSKYFTFERLIKISGMLASIGIGAGLIKSGSVAEGLGVIAAAFSSTSAITAPAVKTQ